jgi:drug/metabolite transporter (DMT)-like permease
MNSGEFFALSSAGVWAVAVILFKKSGETVRPFALNLFRITIATVLLALTMIIAGKDAWHRAPLIDYLILFASGIIAIGISDTLFHLCLNIVGAGINAIVDCTYSPLVVVFAYFLIDERLGPWQFAGMAFVIAGVVVAARHEPPPGISTRRLVVGVIYGLLSMATLAFGIVIAKPVLNRSPVLWATTMRQVGSLLGMLPIALVLRRRREIFSVFKPVRVWKYSLTGTILGSYLALIMWIAGMKYTKTGIAAILNQSTTIYILLFASLFLKEPFTRRKALAAALAIIGIVMVTVG